MKGQAPGPRSCGVSDTKDVKENPSEDQRSVFVHEKGPEIISLMLAVSRSKWLSTVCNSGIWKVDAGGLQVQGL